MCGIVGIIKADNSYIPKVKNVFYDLLFANQLRGVDGAGVFWYNSKDDNYSVIKNENFNVVYNNYALDKALTDNEKIPFIVGHNRAATKGKVKTENNHPFDEGHVILVHNGTMSYIPKEYDKDTKVDSHAIAKMIDTASVEAFMKDSFGAYALTWFHKINRDLSLLRNKDRPLTITKCKEFAVISSEAGLAHWIMSRHGFTPTSSEMIEEHKLYVFNPFNLTPEIKDLTALAKSPPSSKYVYPNNWMYQEDDNDDYSTVANVVPFETKSQQYRPKHYAVELAAKFQDTNAWLYFDKLHHNYNEIITNKNPDGIVHLKKGEPIVFSMDDYKRHRSTMAHFVGNVPGLPMKDYEVRGNTSLTDNELLANKNYYIGLISNIVIRNGKTTIWVKNAEISDKPDPELVIEDSVVDEDIEEKKHVG